MDINIELVGTYVHNTKNVDLKNLKFNFKLDPEAAKQIATTAENITQITTNSSKEIQCQKEFSRYLNNFESILETNTRKTSETLHEVNVLKNKTESLGDKISNKITEAIQKINK